jgi:transcriptional pleiotropic regulator of transition state genes
MQNTGIVRKVDDLGRVVIPMETRRSLGIKPGTPIQIFTDGDKIILIKDPGSCAICGGEAENGVSIENRRVCTSCAKQLKGCDCAKH